MTKIAAVEERNDSTTLIRGNGLLDILGQFSWALRDQAGVIIPSSKTPIARAAMSAAGWTIVNPDDLDTAPASRNRMPLPLPECRNCHQPYRRAAAANIRPGDYCVKCGNELHLYQHDPNAELAAANTSACPECHRTVHRGWLFCRCGAQLDEPTLEALEPPPAPQPWQQRYADQLARSRSETIRAFAAGFGTIPEDDDQ